MPRVIALLCSRRVPSVAALALMSAAIAGCSADTGRFAENQMSSNNRPPEATGSVQQQPSQQQPYQQASQRQAGYHRNYYGQQVAAPSQSVIERQPLAAPATQPAQTYSYNNPPPAVQPGGVQSGGGHGLASYAPPSQAIETTSSVAPKSVAANPAWTKEGGTKIIVGTSDTLDSLAKRYNVPAVAISEANNLHGPRTLSPGQSLVIPRRTASAGSAAPSMVSAPSTRPAHVAGSVHTAGAGDTLMSLSRKHNISVTELARANNMTTATKLRIGDKITIPGGKSAAVAQPAAAQPKIAQAEPAVQKGASASAQPEKAAVAQANDRPVVEKDAKPDAKLDSKEATNSLPGFRWPAKGRVIAAYGAKTGAKSNDGINLSLPEGTPVKAADDGVVAYSGNELKGYGNLVLVRHSNGYVTAYAHASELMVKRGDAIKRGQIIAKSGQTGEVGSPQLHFEIRKGSTPVDPMQFLDGV